MARASNALNLLTVRDIAALPGLALELAAGADGLGNAIRWVHVSELADPTPWLEGGELLITTGLGIGELSPPAARVRRAGSPSTGSPGSRSASGSAGRSRRRRSSQKPTGSASRS